MGPLFLFFLFDCVQFVQYLHPDGKVVVFCKLLLLNWLGAAHFEIVRIRTEYRVLEGRFRIVQRRTMKIRTL